MAAEATLRPAYWHGQYLRAADFEAAIDYARSAMRRHQLGPHTWGIVDGLRFEERPRLGTTTVVDLALTPGVAVDGFGRDLVVRAELMLPVASFARFPTRQWVSVWLEYLAVPAEQPGPGWEPCSAEDLSYRTEETFRVVVGPFAPSHSSIVIDGREVASGLPPDESVPYQWLPPDDGGATWLVPLGKVLWNGTDGFDPLTTDADKAAAVTDRRYAGFVGATLLAPAGELLLGNRPDDVPLDPTSAGVEGRVAGSWTVERDLGVRTPAVSGSPLTVRATGATEETVALRAADGSAGWHLQLAPAGTPRGLVVRAGEPAASEVRLAVLESGNVGIGTVNPPDRLTVAGEVPLTAGLRASGGEQLRLTIGTDLATVATIGDQALQLSTVDQARVTVTTTGRVGVGTTDPNRALTVRGTGGVFGNFVDDSSSVELLVGASGGGVGVVSTMTDHDLQLRAGGNSTKLVVKANGDIGIGTTAPDRDVTVSRDGSAYLNCRDVAVGTELLVGADGNGGIVSTMTSHDLQLRAGGNSTKLIVRANGDIGIGTTAPESRLHVSGSEDADAGLLSSHVGVFENTSTGVSADVLALKVGRADAGSANNFITFFKADTAVAAVEGVAAGGVSYNTASADFAEYLPWEPGAPPGGAGDVVGIHGGFLSHTTRAADHVSVVSTAPGFAGNCRPGSGGSARPVVLVGQAPVRIRGRVEVGDLLAASGRADGTARAIRSDEIGCADAVVGMAWEAHSPTSADDDPGSVLTAVGIGSIALQRQVAALAAAVARIQSAPHEPAQDDAEGLFDG